MDRQLLQKEFNDLIEPVQEIINAVLPETQEVFNRIEKVGRFIEIGHLLYAPEERVSKVYEVVGLHGRWPLYFLAAHQDFEAVKKQFKDNEEIGITKIFNWVERRRTIAKIAEEHHVKIASGEIEKVAECCLSLPKEAFPAIREKIKEMAKAALNAVEDPKDKPEIEILNTVEAVRLRVEEFAKIRKAFERAVTICRRGEDVPEKIQKCGRILDGLIPPNASKK